MRKAHESLSFYWTPFPSKQLMHWILQLKLEASILFLSMFCWKLSLTRSLSRGKAPLSVWETPWTSSFPRAFSLEPLWSVLLAWHIPIHYIGLVGYRPGQGQELLLSTLFHVSFHFAMALYQQDVLRCHDSNTTMTKAQSQTESPIHSPFESHLTKLIPTSNFGLQVSILSKYKETGRERYKL